MKTLKINHLAVWLNVVLLTVLGFLWYGPIFGEPWMAMVGLDMASVEANPPGAGIWITNIIATVVPMYALAWIFTQMKVDTLVKGAAVGFLIAFAFVHLNDMTGNMFAGRPYGLAWITGGFNLLGLTIAGAILGAWRKYGDAE